MCANTYACMQEAAHLHALCGTRVTINVPMKWAEVRYPRVSETAVARDPYSSERPVPEDFVASSVMPEHAILVSLIVLEDGVTFVDTHERDGVLFMARPDFNLRGIVPADSVVHGFMYSDRDGLALLGVFDANKIAGEDVTALAPLQRHCRVFDIFHSNNLKVPAHITYHGVFYEHACLELDCANLPFRSSGVMRLPLSSSDLACERLELATLSLSS